MGSYVDFSAAAPELYNKFLNLLDDRSLMSVRSVSKNWKNSANKTWIERALSLRIDRCMRDLMSHCNQEVFSSDKITVEVMTETDIKRKRAKFIELLGIFSIVKIQQQIDKNDLFFKECVKELLRLKPSYATYYKNLT